MKYTINNTKHYANELSKAVEDKLWFLEHIWVEKMVDIGTANGIVPFTMANKFDHPFQAYMYEPNWNLFWEAQRGMGRLKKNPRHSFTIEDNYTAFMNTIKGLHNVDLCLLSSVLHEVYNQEDEAIVKFYNMVRVSNAKYIAVRDMCVNDENHSTPKHISQAIRQLGPVGKINSFEDQGKHLSKYKDAIEFLLKYRYDVNWEHEVQENYLDIEWEDFHMIMELYGYELFHKRYFIPPFIQQDWKKTFKLNLEGMPNTHCELIYKKII